MQKKLLTVFFFFIFIIHHTFSVPEKYDIFYAKKIYTITSHSINLLLIFSAPFITNNDITDKIYNYYSIFCHQLPERSFSIMGNQLPVCSRCTGIALGRLLGELSFILWEKVNPYRRFSLKKSILYCLLVSSLTLPLIIDGGIQYFTDYESNNMLRLTTGILYGISVTTITDEIVRIIDYYL